MGLVCKTSRWCDHLWTEHLESSKRGRSFVQQGVERQGGAFAGFPADLHARLYLATEPTRMDDAPQWAVDLHEMSIELAEWHSLKCMTARNGFAAGIAAEVMLEKLLPHVPERPDAGDGCGAGDRAEDTATGQSDACNATQDAGAAIRAAIRRASRAARDAVQNAEEAVGGLCPGTAVGSGPGELRLLRQAYERLQDSPRLNAIAKLAGRFERIARVKAKTRVNPGVGEIHGICTGSEIERLLPGELLLLTHPVLRPLLMARLVERRALMYDMRGKEPCACGPVVILLDESGSMESEGRDVWSKAVALAITNRVSKEKRAVHIVGFNKGIRREVAIAPGQGTPERLQQALDVGCSGGTSFDVALGRALDILTNLPSMKKADVLIITDGEGRVCGDVIARAGAYSVSHGVSWYGVGVGSDAAEFLTSAFSTIAAALYRVVDGEDTDSVADIVNLNPEHTVRRP